MRKLYRVLISTEAAEIAELAVVLPLLFTVIFAIFSFARAYNIYSTMTRAAQEAARIAATPVSPSGSSVNVPPSCATATGPGQFPPDTCIAQAAVDVLTTSHLSPQRASQLSVTTSSIACPQPAAARSCRAATGGGASIYICSNVVLNPSSSAQTCGTVVSLQYNYEFLPIPFFRVASIQIPAQAQMRMEY
jgi:hypothetical protein